MTDFLSLKGKRALVTAGTKGPVPQRSTSS